MQRITMSARFHGAAAAPAGDPPQTDPRASSVSIEAHVADGSDAGITRASYENHATYTGETAFTEHGTIVFDDGAGALEIATVGEGTLGPSAEPDLLHGAVLYRVTGGTGRFAGASGLITSNFTLRPAAGEFDERQVGVLFVP